MRAIVISAITAIIHCRLIGQVTVVDICAAGVAAAVFSMAKGHTGCPLATPAAEQ